MGYHIHPSGLPHSFPSATPQCNIHLARPFPQCGYDPGRCTHMHTHARVRGQAHTTTWGNHGLPYPSIWPSPLSPQCGYDPVYRLPPRQPHRLALTAPPSPPTAAPHHGPPARAQQPLAPAQQPTACARRSPSSTTSGGGCAGSRSSASTAAGSGSGPLPCPRAGGPCIRATAAAGGARWRR